MVWDRPYDRGSVLRRAQGAPRLLSLDRERMSRLVDPAFRFCYRAFGLIAVCMR
jgi:hypothetical protein